jgi:hypothetical protein
LSTSPIAKLRAKDDERRQAKRSSLATKLDAEGKALAVQIVLALLLDPAAVLLLLAATRR